MGFVALLTSSIISELFSERSIPVISYALNSREGVGVGSASGSKIEVTLLVYTFKLAAFGDDDPMRA
jgi:hypothetical protein